MKRFDILQILYVVICTTTFLLLFLNNQNAVKAQCTGGNNAGSLTITTSWQTIDVNTYTYYSFDATYAGEGFIFSFCQGGGSNDLDTQLEVHDNTGNSIGFYNDDACSLGSEVNFTAPNAGTFRISIYEFNCNTTTTAAGTLAYKRQSMPDEQDCMGAITVCNETYNETESYFGYGNVLDYTSSSTCSGLCVDPEDNSVWYTFQVQASGVLDFRIDPNAPDSDYDWALFNLTDHDCSILQDIESHTQLITSCNAAYDYGITGANTLSPNTGSNCAPPSTLGEEPINNIPINVTVGEIYYLNIQNWSGTTGGYVLDFSNSTAAIYDDNPPFVESFFEPVCGDNSFDIEFNENIQCGSVNSSDFSITGPGGPYTIDYIAGPACSAGGVMERDFTISFSPAIDETGLYTVTYNGSASDMCGNITAGENWDFTINSAVDIILTSGPSTGDQVICLNDAIANITYDTQMADNVTFSGLPSGVTGDFNAGTQQIVISGTPANTGDFVYTIEVTGDCGIITAQGNISVLDNITPAFSDYGPYCEGEPVPDLPTTSNNGVTGNWSPPSINNTSPGITTYTFTPEPGQCASDVDIDITILDGAIPQFDDFGPYCLNSTPDSLPSTSNNGITGNWSPASINTNNTGIFDYVFTPTSGGSCVSDISISVEIVPLPDAQVSIVSPLNCNGEGAILSVTATSGTSPYTGTGEFEADAGHHEYTVVDANGCSNVTTIDLTPPDPLTGSIITNEDVKCHGDNTGSVQVSISSGNPAYTTTWGNNSIISNLNLFTLEDLYADNYSITVTDHNGCSFAETVTVNEPPPLEASFETHRPSCIGNTDGSIEIYATGGTPPYSYLWNGVYQKSGKFDNLAEGEYFIRVKDTNECLTSFLDIELNDIPVDCLIIPNAFTPNGDGVNDEWVIENMDIFPLIEIRIYNRWGQLLYYNRENNGPWDGRYNNKYVPAGSYIYVIKTYTKAEPVTGTLSVIY